MYKLNSRLSIDYAEEQGIHDEEEMREEKRKGRKKETCIL